MGVIVARPATRPLRPSANNPPWILESNSPPSTSSLETIATVNLNVSFRGLGSNNIPSQVAVISPIASQAKMIYTASRLHGVDLATCIYPTKGRGICLRQY
jgi:hypothetical protein